MFESDFRHRFVDYLVNGMPVSISSEEVPIFYRELDNFINEAPNDFEAAYSRTKDCVEIYDKYLEYLTVSYDDSKIIFKSDIHADLQRHIDPESIMKMGEAFLGVIFFIESISPSADSKSIPRAYRDKWIH